MDWLHPTVRAVRWWPLLGACALAATMLAILRIADQPLGLDTHIGILALTVIAGVAGLHDPARDFVHAVPVSASRRLLQRLVLLGPAVAACVLLVRMLASDLFPGVAPGPGWAALAALGAFGVATCAWLTRRLGTRGVDAAVSVTLCWMLAGVTLAQLGAPFGIAMPWWRWPAVIVVACVAAAGVATTRGAEA